jgi:hypothetical protein
MNDRTIKLNLTNSKVGAAKLRISEKYLDEFREAANTANNKPIHRDTMQAFLRDYDAMDTEIEMLMLSHGLFYSSAIRMGEYMEEYALDQIQDRVFPRQLEAFKALLKLVVTLSNYYKDAQVNPSSVAEKDSEPAGYSGS